RFRNIVAAFNRTRLPRPLVVLTGFCLAVAAAYAQPANDNFNNATDVSGLNAGLWGTNTSNFGGASGEGGEPNHGGFPAVSTIWYKWTAIQDGEVQMDTLATPEGVDTILAVYTGNALSNLRQVAANDDFFPGPQSNINGQRNVIQPNNAFITKIGPSILR